MLRQISLRLKSAIEESFCGKNFETEIESNGHLRTLDLRVPDFDRPVSVTYSISINNQKCRWASVGVGNIAINA